ncbi:hypothetical protein AN916_08485 [Mycobacteroides immunogenum]|nr:hypothetical protein AN916_08485 [Mycobacteroides immunogenum]
MLSQDECNPEDPKTAFAWMFAAGIPDPRSAKEDPQRRFPNQPLIPPQCFEAVSEMLWDFGCRPHADLQTKWIKAGTGPTRNFEVWDVVTEKPIDISKDATGFLVDQFPDKAAEVAAAFRTPEDHKKALEEFGGALQANLAALEAARKRLDEAKGV